MDGTLESCLQSSLGHGLEWLTLVIMIFGHSESHCTAAQGGSKQHLHCSRRFLRFRSPLRSKYGVSSRSVGQGKTVYFDPTVQCMSIVKSRNF